MDFKATLKTDNLINGVWVKADNGETLDVNDPATDQLVATVPSMGEAETRRAIDAAHEA